MRMQFVSKNDDKAGLSLEKTPLRLAMLGMIPGNGHPFSWSSIVNGYDEAELEACPFPVIIDYLSRNRGKEIAEARVTHVWTDDPADAPRVARLARIPTVVSRPEDVIGEVDAVIVAVDDGDDHVDRVRPFVEAGLPVLVDKPLATNADDLRTFVQWQRAGARILSSSGLRYAAELKELDGFTWDWISGVTCNTWKRYGIHILEPLFTLCGPGFVTVHSHAEGGNHYAHLHHANGKSVTIAVLRDAKGAFGTFHAVGPEGCRTVHFRDTYTAFRGQLQAFVDFARGGAEPYPFAETIELMTILIAALESSRQNGAEISLPEYQKSLKL